MVKRLTQSEKSVKLTSPAGFAGDVNTVLPVNPITRLVAGKLGEWAGMIGRGEMADRAVTAVVAGEVVGPVGTWGDNHKHSVRTTTASATVPNPNTI